ncbi:Ser-Thr-rich glycosyl-phosphatidyl-inositol-anchored membrane family-domain-containing protein [Pleurotus pulmonarius]
MFAKVYTLTLLASLVAALQIAPLRDAHSQGLVRVTWTNDADDTSRFASFSVFLHHPSFRSDFAILNNQRPADGGADVTLPVVPAQDGYTLRATDVGNINNEFAVSSSFSIGPEESSSSTIASSTSASSSISRSGSSTGTAAVTLSSGSGTVLSVPPTSAFGVTVSPSPTASSPASGASGASSGSGTNTAAQGGATNFNGAAGEKMGMKGWAMGAAVMGLGWVVGGY